MAFVEVAAPQGIVGAKNPVQSKTEDLAVGSRSKARVVVGHITLAVIALFSIFPVYWMFATSLRLPEAALSQDLIPWPISFENFGYVWEAIPMGSMLVNTFIMAVAVSIGQMFLAVLAAYGFAVWSFRGHRFFMFLFIGSWLVPFQVTMIPNYVLVSQMGLLETIGGVVIPQLTGAFAVILMIQHMRAFPREILEASQLDGRTSWQTLWTVVLPNVKPALAALGIMCFISAWNEYLWPTLIMRQSDVLVQVGVRSFLTAEGNNWGATMAAAGLACIPVLLIYIFLQRYVVDAFVRSGLK